MSLNALFHVAHHLKSWPAFFEPIREGKKTFDLRRTDRDFKVGDTLALHEWRPDTRRYTGRVCYVEITYITRRDFLSHVVRGDQTHTGDACAYSREGLAPGFAILAYVYKGFATSSPNMGEGT